MLHAYFSGSEVWKKEYFFTVSSDALESHSLESSKGAAGFDTARRELLFTRDTFPFAAALFRDLNRMVFSSFAWRFARNFFSKIQFSIVSTMSMPARLHRTTHESTYKLFPICPSTSKAFRTVSRTALLLSLTAPAMATTLAAGSVIMLHSMAHLLTKWRLLT